MINPHYIGYRDAVYASQLQERNIDIITNNLANVNTTGFKADRLIFDDMMIRQVRTIYRQGSMNQTENLLDVAISGQGYFQVQTDLGVRLSRDGAFRMKADGSLVNMDGFAVLGAGGAPITLNPSGGRVKFDDRGGIYQGTERVGELGVVNVADPNTLEKVGKNYYVGTGGKDPQTSPATEYSVVQGALEASNVDVVNEMVNMISAFRSFESYQKIIQTINEMDSRAATQLGRVG